MTTVNLTYRAELRDLTTALGKVEGMNAGLAKKLTTDLERAYGKAEKAAARAASSMQRDTARAFGSIKQSAGAIFGGVVRDIDDVVGAVSSIGMSAEVAMAVGVLGAAALAAGVVAVTQRAVVAMERLDAMGLAAEIPSESRESVQAYADAVAGLSVAFDLLTVQIGGTFGPALAGVANSVTGAVDAMGDLSLTTREGAEAFGQLAQAAAEQLPIIGTLTNVLGLQIPTMETLQERGERLAETYAALEGGTFSEAEMLTALGMMVELDLATDGAAKKQDAYREAVAETAAEINEMAQMHAAHTARMAAAVEGLGAIEQAALAETRSAAERVEAEYQARIERIHELAMATGDLGAVESATAAAQAARVAGMTAAIEAQQQAEEAAHESSIRRQTEIRDAYISTTESVFGAMGASFEVWASTSASAGEELAQQLAEHGESMTDAEREESQKRLNQLRKDAKSAFVASQAIGIAQAEMASALAAIQAYAAVVGIPLAAEPGPISSRQCTDRALRVQSSDAVLLSIARGPTSARRGARR